ncbi:MULTISPECIES: aldo/keto reductase [unclassified Nocardiopsis]|uniref:aldo/keto reductase n=1 Tax=unclassified Nocardiopsis TaxID=2649073 RepID=UPI00135969F8|nr:MULTISPECIES: aldo/keto reductase [unclassified Nocardiopsis]
MATLGNSGIDVFGLTLGGNTFGWTSDKETSFAVLDRYASGGGNSIDSADVYSIWAEGNPGGESETILGEWLTSRGNRDEVVIATKVAQHPQRPGLSPANVAAAAEDSLRRLRTDYIDLYYAHQEDPDTRLEETVAAFDALVKAGKVRAVALSNFSAEQTRRWIEIARETGAAHPVAIQPHYNLVHRGDYEGPLADLATTENLAVLPYFSLASGFLTGKYRSREALAGTNREALSAGYFSEANLEVLKVVEQIAEAHGVAIPTVALAWLRSRPQVVAPIASASRPEQLEALLASVTFTLPEADAQALTDASDRAAR